MGYFYTCEDKDTVISNGGLVSENPDGTVSLFINDGGTGLTPTPITKPCCTALDPSYTFDIDNQLCYWSVNAVFGTESNPFKIILNPVGNGSTIFNIDENGVENCTLNISFDYLMHLDCEDIIDKLADNGTVLNPDDYILIDYNSNIQAKYENCLTELARYQTELSELQNRLVNTPYVITCELTETNFCLTESGLERWLIILGSKNFNIWLNSNGTNTEFYTCQDVQSLSNSGRDFVSGCTIPITARQELQLQIEETQRIINTFNCELILNDLVPISNTNNLDEPTCTTVSEILQSFNIAMTLERVNPSTNKLETIYEQTIFDLSDSNLLSYLQTNIPNTGLMFSGSTGTTNCDNVSNQLMTELFENQEELTSQEIQDLVNNSFNSGWLEYSTTITDTTILNSIANEEINISLKIKNCCVDFSILVDRIKMNKNCTSVEKEEVSITKSPSFDIVRVRDNKKSWFANEESETREFDLRYRDTKYDLNNHKLIINSKEVDLDINPANAMEQDLFCYIQDNIGLLDCAKPLSGMTGTCVDPTQLDCETLKTQCGDIGFNISDILTTPISGISSTKEFKDVITSELIDAKSWKTQTSYPTLKLLYDRYMNSSDYCDNLSSQFKYVDMIQFSELVGTYWVDLIEQVVPSTTIWGSTYVYGNAFWDQQKFRYKKYSLLPCELPTYNESVVSPTSGWTSDVEIITQVIPSINYYNTVAGSITGQTYSNSTTNTTICGSVGIIQTNTGSEFLGKVLDTTNPQNGGDIIITSTN